MSAELIARLRRMADAVGSIGYARALHNEAADALEAAEAEVKRVRDYAERMDALAEQRLMALTQAEAENARLRADIEIIKGHDWCGAETKLAKIDALHPVPNRRMVGHWCAQCNQEWPCPTHRILHPEDGAS